jgi:hypothetical protein
MSRFPRPLVFALAALTVGLVCLPAEAGAPGGGRFGGARAFGGMMGPGGGFNLVGAATNADVQTRLQMSEEQKTEVGKVATESRAAMRGMRGGGRNFRDMTQEERDAFMKKAAAAREAAQKKAAAALEKILGPKYKQLTQIAAGLALAGGPGALGNPAVAEAVGLSKDSQAKVAELVQANRKNMMALFQEMRSGGNRDEILPKIKEATATLNKQISDALTPEEKALVKAARAAAEGIQTTRGGRGRGGRRGAGAGAGGA